VSGFVPDVQGLKEAQAAVEQIFRAVQPDGALGAAVRGAAEALYQGIYGRTHEDTGTLRASERIVWEGALMARIYTSDQRNPKGGRTSVYGPIQEAAVGMYANTFADDVPAAAAGAIAAIYGALP